MLVQNAPLDVIEAVKDYGEAGVYPKLTYTVDGDDITRYVDKADWGWGSGGAQLLNLTVAGRIPLDYQDAEVVVEFSMYDSSWELFASAASRLSHPSTDWKTEIMATTAGGLSDKVTLNKDLVVLGWTPMQVAYNALRRLPYNPSQIRIANLEIPLINRTSPTLADPEDSQFLETEHVKDMLEAVNGDVPILYYDTARGVRLIADPGLGTGLPVDWQFERNSVEIIGWPAPSRMDPDKEFSRVVVLDKNDDGTDRIRSQWPVSRLGRRFAPFGGQTLYIPITDTSSRALEVATYLAKAEADKASRGQYQGDFEVVFNPFLFPGRAIQFEDLYRDNNGLTRTLWLCILGMDVKHNDAAGRLWTTGSYVCTKLDEEFLRPPDLLLSSHSPPWLEGSTAKIFPPAVGRDSDGVFLIKEHTKPSRWIWRDSDGLSIDIDNSEGLAGRDENGLWILREGTMWTSWGQDDATFDELDDYTFDELEAFGF